MKQNVEKFFELYDSDPQLRERIAREEALYPGSLEIRDAVVKEIILPIAESLGLPFTLKELKVYETKTKVLRHPDVELTQADLESTDEEGAFFLIDRGWAYDKNVFKRPDEGEQ